MVETEVSRRELRKLNRLHRAVVRAAERFRRWAHKPGTVAHGKAERAYAEACAAYDSYAGGFDLPTG